MNNGTYCVGDTMREETRECNGTKVELKEVASFPDHIVYVDGKMVKGSYADVVSLLRTGERPVAEDESIALLRVKAIFRFRRG